MSIRIKLFFIIFFIPFSLKAAGVWPLYFSDNSNHNLFSPFIQWNDNKTIFRPFFLHEKNSFQLFYPIVSFTDENGIVKERIFPIFNKIHDKTSKEKSKNFTNLFPLFWGKTNDNTSYGGFFPIYGKLLNRLEYDEVKFFLWPLWTEKIKDNDKDYSFLWPFFGWNKGNNYKGLRFWPFFGFKEKNGIYFKNFFLWPLFIFERKKISFEKDSYEYKNFFFPIYIHTYSPDYNYKTFLWPFFHYNKRKSGYRYWAFPWPFLSYEKKDASGKFFKFSFFPFYKITKFKNYHKQSFLWILFQKENTYLKGKKYTSKTSILLINRFEKNYVAHTTYKNFWPFFEYASKNNDYVLKIFELFPFKLKPVYELYSPFFNFFYIVKKGCKKRINFLWGLFTYSKNKYYKTFKFFQLIKITIKRHEKVKKTKNTNIDNFFTFM